MNDQYEIIRRFLVKVGIVAPESLLSTFDAITIPCELPSCNLLNIVVMEQVSPLIKDMTRHSGTCLLLVTKTYQHSKELLEYNRCTTLDLASDLILVAHMTGMMCTLSMNPTYGVTHIVSSGNKDVDRRNVINMCSSKDLVYSSMIGPVKYNDKPNSLLYHKLVEPLETLGVEYIFSLFKISNDLSVDPSTLVYVFRSEATVNVVYT